MEKIDISNALSNHTLHSEISESIDNLRSESHGTLCIDEDAYYYPKSYSREGINKSEILTERRTPIDYFAIEYNMPMSLSKCFIGKTEDDTAENLWMFTEWFMRNIGDPKKVIKRDI